MLLAADIPAVTSLIWVNSIQEYSQSFSLAVAAAPTPTVPHNICLRQGLHCATARLQDESKSDASSSTSSSTSSSSYSEHYQAHSAKHDAATASRCDSMSYTGDEEAPRPNTRLVKEKQLVVVTTLHSIDLQV